MYAVIVSHHSGYNERIYFTEARCAKDFVDRIRTTKHSALTGVSDAFKIKEHRTVLSALQHINPKK